MTYSVRVENFGGSDVALRVKFHNIKMNILGILNVILGTKSGKYKYSWAVWDLKHRHDWEYPLVKAEYKEKWSDDMGLMLDYVADAKGGDKIRNIVDLMRENIEFWIWEANNLPKALIYSFSVLGHDGKSIARQTGEVTAGPVLNRYMRYRRK